MIDHEKLWDLADLEAKKVRKTGEKHAENYGNDRTAKYAFLTGWLQSELRTRIYESMIAEERGAK